MQKTYIFGHKKPDSDSVMSAIGLSYLKNKLGENTEPRILGDVNKETAYALKYFNLPAPEYLNDVKLQLKDIDWNGMYEISKKQAIETWDSNENEIYRMLNGIKKDDTKESYIERMSKFETYAVITPDGKWHSKDKMGLFSVSTNEDDNRNKSFYDIFIKDADQELILVIVDCHI